MKNDFLVTIGMPAYNAEKYIRKAIDSILRQTWINFEFLIIDDGSTDRTKDIIASYNDPRIKKHFHACNEGIFNTRYELLKSSQGKYFFWMDADDVSHYNRLESQILFMENNPTYILCATNASVIDANENILTTAEAKYNSDAVKAVLFFTFPFYNTTICLRVKSILKQINTYYTKFKVVQAEDYVLYVFLMDKGSFHILEESLVQYRVYESESRVTSSQNKSDIINGRIVAWKIILDYLKVDYPADIIFSIHDKLTYYPDLLTLEETKQLNAYFTFLSTLNNNNDELGIFDRALFTRNISFRIYSTLNLQSISTNQVKKIFVEFRNLLSAKEQFKLVAKLFKRIIENKLKLSF